MFGNAHEQATTTTVGGSKVESHPKKLFMPDHKELTLGHCELLFVTFEVLFGHLDIIFGSRIESAGLGWSLALFNPFPKPNLSHRFAFSSERLFSFFLSYVIGILSFLVLQD